ncbi:MAG: MFS transporter [Pseudomonadota bacterium]
MKPFLSTFPRTFWVANLMELFERGAYYGLNALLAVYLRDKVEAGGLGFQEDEVGLLQGVVYAATYVVPILGGALADRYGYRRVLLFAFSFLSAGYFLSGKVTGYWVIFATLLLMATGSGLFKPIITGTVAKTTDESNSGLGFGIYYWMINLGALIGPLVAGYLKGFSWNHVFVASSLYCAFMFLPTLFVFRDPPRTEGARKLKDVLAGAGMVLSNARFMLLIFVYSCFWILYFQNFGTVLWYLRDFIDGAPVNLFVNSVLGHPLLSWLGLAGKFKLDAEHVTVVNAGTIVLLQLAVSRIVKNLKPLPTMMAGVAIGALGFLLLAVSQYVWVFLAGIAVFSIGEMTCHPKYYSYIGLVAPKEQKAVYMGYAFLYGVVGSLVGSNVGGEMYKAFLSPRIGQTGVESVLRNFWLVFAVLGAATSGMLLVYDRLFGEDTTGTRARARKVMFSVYGLLVLGAGTVLYFVFAKQGFVPVKTWIQAGIMAVVGAGGLIALRADAQRKPA